MTRPPGAAAAGLLGAAYLAAACAPPLVKLPAGPGVPVAAADARAALAQATSACAAVRTMTAEIAVSGSAGGHRLRGRLSAGLAAPASVRLEAVASFGEPLFIFVATGTDATLLLPHDARVLAHGRPADVLEAVAGVPLGASDLVTTLTGCAPQSSPDASAASIAGGRQFGDAWLAVAMSDGDDLYLRRAASPEPWQLAAMTRGESASGPRWRADYADRVSGVPRSIRLASLGGGGATGRVFDLKLALMQVEMNTSLDAGVFAIQVPPDATPISIDELRQSGPLAPPSHGR